MSYVALAIGGASLIGAYVNQDSSRRAADAQTNAANNANTAAISQNNQARIDNQPWRDQGITALNEINAQMPDLNKQFTMSDFQADPGYQFRMDEGTKAIERSAAVRGGIASGRTLKELTRFGQNNADQAYQGAYDRFNNDRSNRFNRLASLAGIGQTANQSNVNSGTNMGNNISNNITSAGNAQAAGSMATGNAVNSGIGQGMNSWMNYQMMNRAFPTQGPSPSTAIATPGGSSGGSPGFQGGQTNYNGGYP